MQEFYLGLACSLDRVPILLKERVGEPGYLLPALEHGHPGPLEHVVAQELRHELDRPDKQLHRHPLGTREVFLNHAAFLFIQLRLLLIGRFFDLKRLSLLDFFTLRVGLEEAKTLLYSTLIILQCGLKCCVANII